MMLRLGGTGCLAEGITVINHCLKRSPEILNRLSLVWERFKGKQTKKENIHQFEPNMNLNKEFLDLCVMTELQSKPVAKPEL